MVEGLALGPVALVLVSFSLILGYPSPPAAESSSWSREIRLGYDFFSHNYQLIDRDTTNSYSEGSASLRIGYQPDLITGFPLEARGELFMGKDYWQGHLEAEVGTLPASVWRWRCEIDGRRYRSSSDLSLTSDHVLADTRLEYSHALATDTKLKIADRIHGIAYGEKTDYLYSSVLNEMEVSLSWGDPLNQSWDLELTHRNMVVPDSSDIGYSSERVWMTNVWFPGERTMFTGDVTAEFRRYPRGSPRAGFWRSDGDLHLARDLTDLVQLESVVRIELENYSADDPVYHDSRTWSMELGPAINLTDRWDLKILPGMEIYQVPSYEDTLFSGEDEALNLQESYRELLLDVSTGYLGLPDLWFDISARVGRRDYRSDQETVDSDYWYLDLSLMAEVSLWHGTYFGATGIFSPEEHQNPEDNTAINILSVWLGYRF